LLFLDVFLFNLKRFCEPANPHAVSLSKFRPLAPWWLRPGVAASGSTSHGPAQGIPEEGLTLCRDPESPTCPHPSFTSFLQQQNNSEDLTLSLIWQVIISKIEF
jgi:hypothetical protein